MKFCEKIQTILFHPSKALDIMCWKIANRHVCKEVSSKFEKLKERFPRDHYAWTSLDDEISYQRFCIQENNLLSFLKDNIPSQTETVIEVGASSGLFLKRINAKNKIGIDVLPECIKRLEQDGITGRLSEGTKIPATNNEADVVICFETLEHVKNPLGMLMEMERILKPQGLLLLSIPWVPFSRVVGRFHDGSGMNRPEAENHIFEFSPNDFQRLLSYSDLVVESYSKLDNYSTEGIAGRLANIYISRDYYPGIQAYSLRKK